MIEYTQWQQKTREIPDEDQTGFYDVPLPHINVFRYATDQFCLPVHRTHFSLKFTLKGQEDYIFSRRRVGLESGTALFANDGEEHASSVRERAESVSIFIPEGQVRDVFAHVSRTVQSALEEPFDVAARQEVPQVAFQPSSPTVKLLRRYLEGCKANPGMTENERLQASTLTLLAHALSDLFKVAPPWTLKNVAKSGVRDELISRVFRARNYIDDTEGSAYDLDELAAVACLSKYHLIRNFSEVVGETPGAYARRCRLIRARQAIEHGSDWACAAREAGYASVRRFRDAYSKQFGAMTG